MSTSGESGQKAMIPWIWLIAAVVATTCLVCPCGFGVAWWLSSGRGPSTGASSGGGTGGASTSSGGAGVGGTGGGGTSGGGIGTSRPAETDQDLIQGTWKVISEDGVGEGTGKKFEVKSMRFTADRISLNNETFTYTLYPSKNPKALDFVELTGPDKGKTRVFCIYALEGDTLKICGSKERRPLEFKFNQDDIKLFVLKREKH
jgi:uncharacterized protein (TIGR03067 family)